MKNSCNTIAGAIAWADYWLEEYHEHSIVYHVKGPDRFGRRDVFYVRHTLDLAPCCSEIVYRTVAK